MTSGNPEPEWLIYSCGPRFWRLKIYFTRDIVLETKGYPYAARLAKSLTVLRKSSTWAASVLNAVTRRIAAPCSQGQS